jgi:hypothetical protein
VSSPTVAVAAQPERTSWQCVLEVLKENVLEFNSARGSQFLVSIGERDNIIQIVPKQPPLDTAVIEWSPISRTIQVTCPISHPGLPRRGEFKFDCDGRIVSVGDFTGEPKPPTTPMTAEEFSEAILQPLLFPAA